MLLTCLRQSFHAPQVILLCNCFSSFITWYLALHSAIKVLVSEESCCFLIKVGMVSGTTAWAFTINAPFSSNHCSSVSILMVVVFSFVHVSVLVWFQNFPQFLHLSAVGLHVVQALISPFSAWLSTSSSACHDQTSDPICSWTCPIVHSGLTPLQLMPIFFTST